MGKITDIEGLLVGHATHPQEATGCTVVLASEGAIAGVDVRGSAPGSRETELLKPGFMIQKVHAIVLTGGSAFGLRTVDGVVNYLARKGIGYNARGIIVPIVPAAVIFDLREGRSTDLPSVEMGEEACRNAGKDFAEGLVGAGRGATVGKILGIENCMAGGLASTSIELPSGVRVGVLVVVNALGDVIDPSSGQIVAGARMPGSKKLADSYQVMMTGRYAAPLPSNNTTLAVVATDAALSKEQVNKLAQMAQNGIARAICPVHTMYDGDMVFALSVGNKTADINLLGEVAAHLVSEAIVRAVKLSNQIS